MLSSSRMPNQRRVAFVTIGQSPRDDMLPEMLAVIGPGVVPVEVGVLDGLAPDATARLAPGPDDRLLVSRLRDGGEARLGARWVRQRLQEILDRLDAAGVDLIVLLCTGHFEGLRARTLLVEAQRVTDQAVAAFAEDGRTVGVLVPEARQVGEFHARGAGGVVLAHASPYAGADRFVEAAQELAKADVIVMHCMGYSEAMRRRVAEAAGRPVLLARRLVASMVAQLVA